MAKVGPFYYLWHYTIARAYIRVPLAFGFPLFNCWVLFPAAEEYFKYVNAGHTQTDIYNRIAEKVKNLPAEEAEE